MNHRPVLAALLAPAIAAAEPSGMRDPWVPDSGLPAPLDDDAEHPEAPMFAGGATMFVGAYAASAVAAATSERRGFDRLFIPGAGPWLALYDWAGTCPLGDPTCNPSTAGRLLLVADGIAQAAGVALVIESLVVGHRTEHALSTGVHIAPQHDGITVFGRF